MSSQTRKIRSDVKHIKQFHMARTFLILCAFSFVKHYSKHVSSSSPFSVLAAISTAIGKTLLIIRSLSQIDNQRAEQKSVPAMVNSRSSLFSGHFHSSCCLKIAIEIHLVAAFRLCALDRTRGEVKRSAQPTRLIVFNLPSSSSS
jgi:hypothetical protein